MGHGSVCHGRRTSDKTLLLPRQLDLVSSRRVQWRQERLYVVLRLLFQGAAYWATRLSSGPKWEKSMSTPSLAQNAILAALSVADYEILQPDLEAVELPLRTPLERRMKRAEHVYFMESGLASVVADGDRPIEVGVIGREGMTGVSVVLAKATRLPTRLTCRSQDRRSGWKSES